MKQLFVLLLICCYHATNMYAQQYYSLPDADAIGLNGRDDNIEIYTKIGPNQYTMKTLLVRPYREYINESSYAWLIDWKISQIKDTLSIEDIDKNHIRFIEAKDLHAVDFNDFVGKTFTVNDNGKWIRETKNATFALKFLRPDLSTIQQLLYQNNKYKYNMSILSGHIPDSVVTWRSDHSEYFTPLILEIKGGKKIFFLFRSSISYVILPNPKGGQMYMTGRELNPVELTNAGERYAQAKPYDFLSFNIGHHYDVQKTANGKYKLANILGEDVLKEAYDSINLDPRFIIAKRGSCIDVFNLYLDKLNIGRAKVVKPIEESKVGCIEVLNEDGAYYYDEMGKRVNSPDKIRIGWCGSVPEWRYFIIKDKHKYIMRFWGFGSATRYGDRPHWLSDLLLSDSVTFLDGETEFSYDGNSWIREDINVHPEWIRVGRRGKFGIVAYKYKETDEEQPKARKRRKANLERTDKGNPVIKITGKTILPINNDSIIMRSDGLIYFYKGKKVGLYPRDKTPTYDEIKQVTTSFYHIVKNGISSWFDFKTGKEYRK